jgi:hypothetical protein
MTFSYSLQLDTLGGTPEETLSLWPSIENQDGINE